MRKFLLSVAAALALWGSGQAQISPDAYQRWYGSKYSMFIHFGLYSELGGVWEGKPVTAGYSEQIQSFAGIFSDWYGETALRFNPTRFNADEIVALAKEAGMRSIVITTKHHDGFCMFRTATTDYNSWEATPAPRDFVKELADACRRGGLRLGLYYSNIDWHFPQAYPISSHNCDFVTPEHFELSKAQIRELLTNYGPISELWFDMGSHTPEQSREMYNLVHELQPDCMVSGRLGNDAYDFSVMADNKYPESALQVAWQTAASMFDETWSYRSWQERGSAVDKAEEKLRSLLGVVSHGGNFLLNIGPKADGTITDEQKDVLLSIGKWLKVNGEAIYGTRPWKKYGEGDAITTKGSFSDNTATQYTSRDMRFTTKGNDFYAIVLNGDADYVLVKSLDAATIGDAKIRRVRLLGSKEKLRWEQTGEGLKIYFPAQKPCEYAYSFKISFKGEVGKNLKSEASDEVMKHGV